MVISGLQKLTLLDYPGRTACTVFTLGCNFRCPFCHNTPLVNYDAQERYFEQEILDYLKTRKGKLDGICISGGEPLLQPDLKQFLQKVKDLGFLVKIDTNGSLPEVLEDIIKNNLCDFIAMDIKNCPTKYNITSGAEVDFKNIKKSVSLILNSGKEYEFRTTVTNELHEDNDFVEIAKLIKGAKAYFLQAFKDSGNVLGKGLSSPDKQKMLNFRRILIENGLEKVELRGID